jgi:hypothetical protein
MHLQGTAYVNDYEFNHDGIRWILRDTPGLSGKHDVPPSMISGTNGELTPGQFVKHYGLGKQEVDGILFITS